MRKGRRASIPQHIRERLGENIRRERVIRNMTQAELAREIDSSQMMVSRFEKGKDSPSVWRCHLIAKAFGTTIEELLTEEPKEASMQYFAYGFNMNFSHMQQLCPGIARIGPFQLKGFRLVFNYFADIIPAEGGLVHGGLWKLTTKDHEVALDRFESYPLLYGKYRQDNVMFYRMEEASVSSKPPSISYLKDTIQGYKDFGLTQENFEESLGVQRLGLAPADIRQIIGVSMDELERLFSHVPTSPPY